MNVIELLEATKVEVDERWARGYQLWDTTGETDCACVLGCLGFAAFGEDFSATGEHEDPGYGLLRNDEGTSAAIEVLAKHARRYSGDPIQTVYRENDSRIYSKQQAKAFVDRAIADLKSS